MKYFDEVAIKERALISVMIKLIPIAFHFRQQVAKKLLNWAANHS